MRFLARQRSTAIPWWAIALQVQLGMLAREHSPNDQYDQRTADGQKPTGQGAELIHSFTEDG